MQRYYCRLTLVIAVVNFTPSTTLYHNIVVIQCNEYVPVANCFKRSTFIGISPLPSRHYFGTCSKLLMGLSSCFLLLAWVLGVLGLGSWVWGVIRSPLVFDLWSWSWFLVLGCKILGLWSLGLGPWVFGIFGLWFMICFTYYSPIFSL